VAPHVVRNSQHAHRFPWVFALVLLNFSTRLHLAHSSGRWCHRPASFGGLFECPQQSWRGTSHKRRHKLQALPPRRSELQNLIDPLAEFWDARVNAGLIRRGATDAPTDDSSEDPPFVPCPLDDHRTAAITLRNAEDYKVRLRSLWYQDVSGVLGLLFWCLIGEWLRKLNEGVEWMNFYRFAWNCKQHWNRPRTSRIRRSSNRRRWKCAECARCNPRSCTSPRTRCYWWPVLRPLAVRRARVPLQQDKIFRFPRDINKRRMYFIVRQDYQISRLVIFILMIIQERRFFILNNSPQLR